MKRLWMGAAAMILLGLVPSSGPAQDQSRVRIIPNGPKPGMMVTGENMEMVKPGEFRVRGNVTITLQDGVKLHVPQYPVRIVSGGPAGSAEIFVGEQPSSATRK
jgi:hypothetical protein